MKVLITAVTLLFSLSVVTPLCAQEKEKEEVIKEMRDLYARYKTASYLSFDISYRFASLSEPDLSLDSLEGEFKINGNQYWYVLDSTEVLSTKAITVMVFKEDRLLYLSRSIAQAVSNPVSFIDSFLLKSKDISFKTEETKAEKVLTLEFRPGQAYQKLIYRINKGSGFITGVKCFASAALLYDPSVRAQVTGDAVAIIDITMSNYRTGLFTEALFDPSHYFIKEGAEYRGVGRFNNYKIFFGSPNL